jgi:hypothetical protein
VFRQEGDFLYERSREVQADPGQIQKVPGGIRGDVEIQGGPAWEIQEDIGRGGRRYEVLHPSKNVTSSSTRTKGKRNCLVIF